MKEIGNFLREKRGELGLSLEEIEKATKIRKKYLQALEDGNFEIIPGNAYILGYIKNYAKILNIKQKDINDLITAYKFNLKKEKVALEETKKIPGVIKKKEKYPPFKKSKSTFTFPFKYFYLISFLIIILIGLFWVNHSLRKAENIPVPSPEITNKLESEDLEGENIKSEEIAILEENMIKNEQAIEEILPEKKLPILKVIATNNTWLKILSPDQKIFEGILLVGEEISWQKDSELDLITEYPPQVDVFYNNEKIELKQGTINNSILSYNFSFL